MRVSFIKTAIFISITLLLFILSVIGINLFRVDLTTDKRYSIAPITKETLEGLNSTVEIKIYLYGDIDINFTRLRRAVTDIIGEFNGVSNNRIKVSIVDPKPLGESLLRRGIRPMSVSNQTADNQLIQSIIYPFADVISGKDTIPVTLINPTPNSSNEENINRAIETLEYEFIDAIKSVTNKNIEKIAFIEGHDELDEWDVYDAASAISKYYQVDRGVLGSDPAILDDYKAIVIANPQKPFSESDKYIIDQYIMKGGSVLWLLDGVFLSAEKLSETGYSPMIPHELNLNDMLFRYGVKVTSTLVQDKQCATIPINVAAAGEPVNFRPLPWLFAPLLLTSPDHSITKGLMLVKGEFSSVLEFPKGNDKIQRDILLVTSNATNVMNAPGEVNIADMAKTSPEDFFQYQYAPIAVALEGKFESNFRNRMIPANIETSEQKINEGKDARMIVVSCGNIIKNDIIEDEDGGLSIIPLGRDRFSPNTYGNRLFILNSIQYLTDEKGFISLRNISFPLRLLNKSTAQQNRLTIQILNVILPLFILVLVGLCHYFYRKRIISPTKK